MAGQHPRADPGGVRGEHRPGDRAGAAAPQERARRAASAASARAGARCGTPSWSRCWPFVAALVDRGGADRRLRPADPRGGGVLLLSGRGTPSTPGVDGDLERLRRAVRGRDLQPQHRLERHPRGLPRPDLGDAGQRHPADRRRPVGRPGLPGRPVQHRRPGPDHPRARSSPATSASTGTCRSCCTCSLAIAAGMLGGALWGGIAGWLKARTGAHEVITTIMLNYIAVLPAGLPALGQGLPGAAVRPGDLQPGATTTPSCSRCSATRCGCTPGCSWRCWRPRFTWWLLKYSRLGFRLRAVGANPFAARTAGMSVERSYTTVMLIAGALAGLAGVSQILGTNTQITGDIDAGIGFDAITVALLGRANPVGIVFAGLLFGALHAGGSQMQSYTPIDLVQVIQSLIVLFIAAPALIRTIFRLRTSTRGSGPSSRRDGTDEHRRPAAAGPTSSSSTRWSTGPAVRDRLAAGVRSCWSALVTIQFLALALPGGHDATLKLGPTTPRSRSPTWCCPAGLTALVLGVVVHRHRGLAHRQGVLPPVQCPGRWVRRLRWRFMVAFLCWVSARGDGATIDVVGLLQNTDRARRSADPGRARRRAVRALRRHQHRHRGPDARRRLVRRPDRQPACRSYLGLAGGRRRRRADGRHAGGLLDQVPGQPGGPRRGAQRLRPRPDRVLLRRLHAAQRAVAEHPAGARRHRHPGALADPGPRPAAVPGEHRGLPDVRAHHRRRRGAVPHPLGAAHPCGRASTPRRRTPSASRCSRRATAT